IDDMMRIQYLSFSFAHLANILISRKGKIAHIMIAICLSLLIIHTLNFQIYHFLGIKLPNFYRQIRIWYKGIELINPEECIVYPTADAWRKPPFWSSAILKPGLAITRFSMTSGTSICASGFQ